MSKQTRDYVVEYQRLHAGEGVFLHNGIPRRSKDLFTGSNFVKKLLPEFTRLIRVKQLKGARILDYGCGKAKYLTEPLSSFGVTNVPRPELPLLSNFPPGTFQSFDLYDPGHVPFSSQVADITRHYDIVICADVMEHIPEEEVDEVLFDLTTWASTGSLLMSISCQRAVKSFDDGENLHITVRDPQWWKERIRRAMPVNHVYVVFDLPGGESMVWETD